MHCKSYSHFFSKKIQHICVSIDVNFNKKKNNNVVSFEQLDPEVEKWSEVTCIRNEHEKLLVSVHRFTRNKYILGEFVKTVLFPFWNGIYLKRK